MVKIVAPVPTVVPLPGLTARLAGDAGALLLANAAFLGIGMFRTKLSATMLGPQGLGIVSQLTQLSSLVVFTSALGLGTGTRVVLSRSSLSDEKRAEVGKGLVILTLSVGVVATGMAMLLAAPLAGALLGNRDLASELRIALLAVPLSALSQLLLPMAQAWGEFRRIAVAAVVTAILGLAVTLPMLASGRLRLAVATIPIAAGVQVACVAWASPAVRRTLRASRGGTSALLREVLSVGGLSFALGGTALVCETLVRALMVRTGGLMLVASYQPIYLLSSSGFGLLLGAVGTTLMVHIAREAEGSHPSVVAASMNDVLVKTLVIVSVIGFGAQIGMLIYIPLFFSTDLLGVARAVAYQMPVEVIRASVWILGSALLPLSLRRHWLLAGLGTVLVQTLAVFTTVTALGVFAAPLGSAAGWLVGLVITLHGLSRRGVRLAPSTAAVIVWTIGLQGLAAMAVNPGRAYSLSGVPISLAILWCVPLGAWLVYRRRRRATAE